MRFAAKVLGLFFAFILLVFIISPHKSFAQSSSTQLKQTLSSNMDPNVPVNLHTWTQNVMIETMSSMICQLTGIDPINSKQSCLGIDKNTGRIGFVKESGGGAIGMMGNLLTATYLIPVHTSDYIAYAAKNFGIINTANAADNSIGFVGLSPVLGLFTIFRNLAYLLMMVIFIIVGIAIMLRLRIDLRTVMTIQNQIPKLIIGLVMITFSYAIAGLLIDAMWVTNFLVIDTLTPNAQHVDISKWATESSIGFTNDMFGGKDGGILGLSASAASSVGSLVHNVLASNQVSGAMTDNNSSQGCFFLGCWVNTIMDAFWHLIASLIGFIAGIIVFLIFVIAVIVALFRLWFALLKCFINVLLGTILAPLWILGGLIPGASGSLGFTSWIKNMAGNLAPFPATLFVFIVARTIMDALSQSNAGTMFNPPIIGNVTGGGNQTMYGALIAVGFILASPSIVEKVRKTFGAGGSGLSMGGVGTGQAAVAGFAGGVASRMYYRDPRTNQMRGFVGSRLQRYTAGNYNESSKTVQRNALQRATGFVARTPSSQEVATASGRHDQLKAVHEEITGKKPNESNITGGTDTGGTGLVDRNGKPIIRS